MVEDDDLLGETSDELLDSGGEKVYVVFGSDEACIASNVRFIEPSLPPSMLLPADIVSDMLQDTSLENEQSLTWKGIEEHHLKLLLYYKERGRLERQVLADSVYPRCANGKYADKVFRRTL